jgi:hypothetical protein
MSPYASGRDASGGRQAPLPWAPRRATHSCARPRAPRSPRITCPPGTRDGAYRRACRRRLTPGTRGTGAGHPPAALRVKASRFSFSGARLPHARSGETGPGALLFLRNGLVRDRHRARIPCPVSVAVPGPALIAVAVADPAGAADPAAGLIGPPVAMPPMVRWASCPPCGRLSEGWWPMRGLEAHATKDPLQPLTRSPRMKQTATS